MSNILASNATIKQIQEEALLNIKGQYTKQETNTYETSKDDNDYTLKGVVGFKFQSFTQINLQYLRLSLTIILISDSCLIQLLHIFYDIYLS